ncbi:hypothetical protein A3715_15825 [Oleiphilus sp. HI0009]|nr:hypothetical protein A3715_15825 [Oleiphilus sp. HI0009]
MPNYSVPEKYIELQNEIDQLMTNHKVKRTNLSKINPYGQEEADDPLESASIYLFYGQLDSAISSIEDAVKNRKNYANDTETKYIAEHGENIELFLEKTKSLPSFTPPKLKPWYKRLFSKDAYESA